MSAAYQYCISWDSFREIFEENFGLHYSDLNDLFLKLSVDHHLSWNSEPEWESFEDTCLLKKLNSLKKIDGRLTVITEVCYRKNFGPFIVDDDIIKFVDHHLKKFGECFFNGDVLIVNFDKKQIWAFDHEGMYTCLTLK